MTNKQETNTADVEKAFEEWFGKNPFDPSRLPFEAGFTAGAHSRDEEIKQLKKEIGLLRAEAHFLQKPLQDEIEQLREDLKWLMDEFQPDLYTHLDRRDEILKRHNLEGE